MSILFHILIVITGLWLVIQRCEAGQTCASCSKIARPDDCQHHINCDQDEECFIHKYATELGTTFYDLGCISTQACSPSHGAIVGKREVGHHIRCMACCNDTMLCNQYSACGGTPTQGRTCAFCSGVPRLNSCQKHITCAQDEKCYVHRYTTETGSSFYDLGCVLSQACPSSSQLMLEKRTDDHHIRCASCCNSTDLCNQYMTCDEQPKTETGGAKDCSEFVLLSPHNGTYTIYPSSTKNNNVSVYCIFDNTGAWTVIQRRFNGSVDFYRPWDDYKKGFGHATGEYWIGNEILHELTSRSYYELKVILTDISHVTKYAEYSDFRIGSEATGYNLTIGGYSGDAGDSLAYHNGMKFTTYDRDSDMSSSNCARLHHGAWWYGDCYDSNLNGKYFSNYTAPNYDDGITWEHWRGYNYSFKSTIMMIKTR